MKQTITIAMVAAMAAATEQYQGDSDLYFLEGHTAHIPQQGEVYDSPYDSSH